VFMVFVGSRSCPEEKNEFGGVLVGVLATAIAMMMFVALVRDADQRRFQDRGLAPVTYQQDTRSAGYSGYRTY
jgi:hypothetical protein